MITDLKAYKREWAKKHYWENRESILQKSKLNPQRKKSLKRYYLSHKEDCKTRSREASKQIKKEVISVYTGGKNQCACCGETHLEFLSVDHVNGNGNKHRKQIGMSGHPFYLWLRKNNYPDGFRILCHNCNQSIGSYGYCPHGVKND